MRLQARGPEGDSGFADHVKQNQLKIVAAYYDLASGKATTLD